MGWYRAGTVSVTQNSTAVIGAGTAWVTAVALGETFVGPDGQSYEVAAINGGASLTITPAYKGSTASGQSYAIMPTQSYMRDLAIAAAALVEGYSAVKNNAGVGKFAAGTSASPSLRGAADENTGLNFLGNDVLALITAGIERLRLDKDGTPSGTASDYLRARSNHTGTQAISTVDGLQTALNSKETPAGALAQMRGFGLGSSVVNAPSVADIQSLNALNSGIYRSISANIADSPGGNTTGFFINLPYLDTGEGTARLFVTRDNPPRLFTRLSSAAAWLPWAQIAPVASPAFTGTPSAPSLKLGNVASTDVNTLDYYEEGTFTPVLYGATTAGDVTYASGVGGNYTRIGNRVLWSAWVSITALANMAGFVRMSGLPFIVRNGARYRGAVNLSLIAGLVDTTLTSFAAYHANNTAYVEFFKKISGQAGFTTLQATDIGSTFQIYMSGQYEV